MDHKDLDQDVSQEEFSLDDILREFHTEPEDRPEEEVLTEEDSDQTSVFVPEEPVPVEEPAETPAPEEAESSPEEAVPEPEEAELSQVEDDLDLEELNRLTLEDSHETGEAPQEAGTEFDPDSAKTVRVDAVPEPEEAEAPPIQPPLVYDPRARLRELKRKIVAGPEKRYYALSELGLGKLQAAILLNLLLVVLCAGGAVLFSMNLVPENRMRLLIFSQVLAMLLSALLGLYQMMDGFSELFRGRFTVNTMLCFTFLACCADAVFCLKELRVPCCCAFCLEMTFALSARYQRRNTEMGQMDTLRKANKLRSLVMVPDYYQGKPALLRGEGELEDFWNVYQISSAPQKIQNFYAFFSFLICIAIAVLAGMLHGLSMALQIFATSLLVAVPASFFVALTRPAALLERRLHMVGSVICGWKGVKGLCGSAAFPLTDGDLFPQGAAKLNGVKFYSERDPDMIVSYTSSLILQAGGGLVPIFNQMMESRGVVANPVQSFSLYDNGGIGGEVCGESVLVGTSSFLQEMGVNIPEGTMVNQAVYAAIDGQLSAVVAISYAKMRSAAAGMVTLCGYRKLTPVFVGSDFILTEEYLRSKFEVKTKRLQFPSAEARSALLQKQIPEGVSSLALSTRSDLVSFAYTVTGARALRQSSRAGLLLHLVGGILGLLIMAVLAITGSTELLTPINILLYQLVWMVPGFLITEWARHV